jgi:hypothetical protein
MVGTECWKVTEMRRMRRMTRMGEMVKRRRVG